MESNLWSKKHYTLSVYFPHSAQRKLQKVPPATSREPRYSIERRHHNCIFRCRTLAAIVGLFLIGIRAFSFPTLRIDIVSPLPRRRRRKCRGHGSVIMLNRFHFLCGTLEFGFQIGNESSPIHSRSQKQNYVFIQFLGSLLILRRVSIGSLGRFFGLLASRDKTIHQCTPCFRQSIFTVQ